MKFFPIYMVLLGLLGITATIVLSIHKYRKPHHIGYLINLPEEINAVSTNPNKPDTMICYRSNDTLYLGYSQHIK